MGSVNAYSLAAYLKLKTSIFVNSIFLFQYCVLCRYDVASVLLQEHVECFPLVNYLRKAVYFEELSYMVVSCSLICTGLTVHPSKNARWGPTLLEVQAE
jgi:hypothetical protein